MVDSEQSNNNKKVIDVHRTLRLLLNWISSRKLKCGKEKREKLNLQKLEEKGSTVRYLEGGKEKIQDNCSVEIQSLCFLFRNKKNQDWWFGCVWRDMWCCFVPTISHHHVTLFSMACIIRPISEKISSPHSCYYYCSVLLIEWEDWSKRDQTRANEARDRGKVFVFCCIKFPEEETLFSSSTKIYIKKLLMWEFLDPFKVGMGGINRRKRWNMVENRTEREKRSRGERETSKNKIK